MTLKEMLGSASPEVLAELRRWRFGGSQSLISRLAGYLEPGAIRELNARLLQVLVGERWARNLLAGLDAPRNREGFALFQNLSTTVIYEDGQGGEHERAKQQQYLEALRKELKNEEAMVRSYEANLGEIKTKMLSCMSLTGEVVELSRYNTLASEAGHILHEKQKSSIAAANLQRRVEAMKELFEQVLVLQLAFDKAKERDRQSVIDKQRQQEKAEDDERLRRKGGTMEERAARQRQQAAQSRAAVEAWIKEA